MTRPPLTRRSLLAVAVAAPLAARAAPQAPNDRFLVDRAVTYLQGLSEARARFIQTDGRGASTTGTLFLKRPGKARFAYDPPSGLLVVSNGSTVAVADSRLKTFAAYPLMSTPLSLFLAKTVRLDQGAEVTHVSRAADGFSLTARDGRRQTAGEITLTFKEGPLTLVGWSVTDAQSRVVRVELQGLSAARGLDPGLFVLKDPRPPPPGRARM